MVRDSHGRKMSKSLGNVIDPIDVIEGIPLLGLQKRLDEGNLDPKEIVKAKEGQVCLFNWFYLTSRKTISPMVFRSVVLTVCLFRHFLTWALRFTLLAYTSAGRDINLDVLRIEGYRKFCNKLWNATKFALLKLGDEFKPAPSAALSGKETLAERWILHKLNKAVEQANSNIQDMNFIQATSAVYNFWLYELCDVYIEVCKTLIDQGASETAAETLFTCLDEGLKLLHPMMPFVTEELYQRLPQRQLEQSPSICVCKYPTAQASRLSTEAEAHFDSVMLIVSNIRSLISDYSIKGATGTYLHFLLLNSSLRALFLCRQAGITCAWVLDY